MLDTHNPVRYSIRQILNLGRGYYPDIAHEPAALMQRFEFQIDIDAVPPWVNPYRALADGFKAEHANMLIQDVKIAENTLHKRFYVLILARPKTDEELYLEALDYFLNN
jgi:hypothetical protein